MWPRRIKKTDWRWADESVLSSFGASRSSGCQSARIRPALMVDPHRTFQFYKAIIKSFSVCVVTLACGASQDLLEKEFDC